MCDDHVMSVLGRDITSNHFLSELLIENVQNKAPDENIKLLKLMPEERLKQRYMIQLM